MIRGCELGRAFERDVESFGKGLRGLLAWMRIIRRLWGCFKDREGGVVIAPCTRHWGCHTRQVEMLGFSLKDGSEDGSEDGSKDGSHTNFPPVYRYSLEPDCPC